MEDILGNCPVERLILASALLREVDPGLGQWLADAIHQHVHEGELLDHALGLSGELGRSPRFAFLRRQRNHLLSQALAGLEGDLERLATEIQRFETRVPAHVREASQPPADWPGWRKAIHAAGRLGLALPNTARGLRKTLAGTEPSLFRSGGLSNTEISTITKGDFSAQH